MAETAVAPTLMTAEEFIALPDDGARRELVAGEVVEMAPAGAEHTGLAFDLSVHLTLWARARGMGYAMAGEVGCRLGRDPDTVRAPDAVFYAGLRDRRELPVGFVETLPELVVEVVSPNDRRADVAAEAAMWLEAGVQVVWVVWPRERLIQVWRAGNEIDTVRGDETLTCEDLLPGFALPLATLFGAG